MLRRPRVRQTDGHDGRHQLARVDARGLRPVPGTRRCSRRSGRDGAPCRRAEPHAGCWRSPQAPGSSPPGWWRRCPTPRSPRPTSTHRWSTTPRPASPGPTWRSPTRWPSTSPTTSFDLVVCQFGVMFLPDQVGGYREVRRVLEPDGPSSSRPGTPSTPPSCRRPCIAVLAEVLPDNPPDFMVRIPHGYADPTGSAPTSRRPVSGSRSVERVVLRGWRHRRPRSPRASASARRCGSSCRSAATSPRSSRRCRADHAEARRGAPRGLDGGVRRPRSTAL